MIYFLYGKNKVKAKDKFDALLLSLSNKKKDATLFRFNDMSWNSDTFDELIASQGLFEKKYIAALNNVFLNKEAKEHILDRLEEIKDSESIFIFLEEEVDKKTLNKFENHAEKVQEFEEKRAETKEAFNVFAITDAIGARDRKRSWVLYQKALAEGLAAEELFWRLVWQSKAMLAASKSKDANSAGQKPFVYSKSKKAAQNYSESELVKLSSNFTKLYHDSRRGITEFEIGLEKILLGL